MPKNDSKKMAFSNCFFSVFLNLHCNLCIKNKEYSNKINLNDKILITGNLINYTGRTSQTQSVINSYDLEILNRNKNKEVER